MPASHIEMVLVEKRLGEVWEDADLKTDTTTEQHF